MKKFVAQLVIVPSDQVMPLQALRDLLESIGGVTVEVLEEVTTASADDKALTHEYWIYSAAADELPYQLVSGPRIEEGVDLPDEALNELVQQGVCTKFHGLHPRSDRYGAPLYAASESIAEAVVSDHFLVASEGLEVHCSDRGDDGGDQHWFCVKSKDLGRLMPELPAVQATGLQERANEVASEEEEPHRFRNFYVHKDCPKQPGVRWDSTWSCMCNERCPACDAEIEPESSEDLDVGGEVEGEATALAEA